MNALKDALTKAGFAGFAELPTRELKRRWLLREGLISTLPIKQVRLHLGVVRTSGGLQICQEEYRRRVGE